MILLKPKNKENFKDTRIFRMIYRFFLLKVIQNFEK